MNDLRQYIEPITKKETKTQLLERLVKINTEVRQLRELARYEWSYDRFSPHLDAIQEYSR